MHPGNLSHRTARPGIAVALVLQRRIQGTYCSKKPVFLTSCLWNSRVGSRILPFWPLSPENGRNAWSSGQVVSHMAAHRPLLLRGALSNPSLSVSVSVLLCFLHGVFQWRSAGGSILIVFFHKLGWLGSNKQLLLHRSGQNLEETQAHTWTGSVYEKAWIWAH